MAQKPAEFDLVVFGAAGFAGRVAVDYFANKLSPTRRWAVVARSREKLDSLKEGLKGSHSPPSEYLIADHVDAQGVRALVSRARVVINYAGPFGRSGENIVAACAELGTHYLDITGESLWVARMIEKYAAQAAQSGAILIPFSGFDSVPSDLGVWKAVALAREKHPTRPITKVVNLLSVRGGINGGTYETLLDMLELSEEDRRRHSEPSLLVPADLRAHFCYPELKKPVRVPEAGITAPPFFMEPINSKVVYRSQALAGGEPYQYVELMRLAKGAWSVPQAWAYYAGAEVFYWAGRKRWGRRLLKRFGIKSGHWPSPYVQKNGFFRACFFAYSGDQLVARFEMSYPGDPGNRATAVLSCESAMCLIEDWAELKEIRGGFWTPSTALGAVLYRRLLEAGVQFTL